jgi:hypothetical protein
MSSATKAELAGLYIMAHEAVYIRIILEELGHKQPPTPHYRLTTQWRTLSSMVRYNPIKKSHGHQISLATRPWMSTTIQNILETRQDELRHLLDKTSFRIASQEHTKTKIIPHAKHCSQNDTNRTTTTTKGCVRSMKIWWFSMIVHKYAFQNASSGAITHEAQNFTFC